MPDAEKSERFGASAADTVFVWAVWAAMVVAAVYFVGRWSVNRPHPDDDEFARVLRGDEPVTWDWLWMSHNEHRLPLPKLVMLGLFHTSGGDWRSGMYFDVACFAAVSALLILSARRARGWTVAADAFLPMVLLHWGYVDAWLWGFGCLNFVLTPTLACVALAAVVWKPRPERAGCWWVGLCLAGLILCGGTGIAMVPPLLLWLFGYGLATSVYRSAALGAAAVTVAAAAFYAINNGVPPEPHYAGLLPTAQVSIGLLSSSFGPILDLSYWTYWAVLVLALLALAVVVTIGALFRNPAERWRAAGLLACLAAEVCLAAAIGLGRARMGTFIGLTPRYMVATAPLPCAIYLAVVLYVRGSIRHWLQIGLLLLAISMVWVNAQRGIFRATVLLTPGTQIQRWN
jgi:hypothetical protein